MVHFAWSNEFISLPAAFVTREMPKANSGHIKVYLYGIWLCGQKKELPNEDMAKVLGLEVSEVADAWNHWEKQGLIERTSEGDIVFLSAISEPEIKPAKKSKGGPKPPVFTPAQLKKRIAGNTHLADLIQFVEAKNAKYLSSTDLNIIYSFYDFYKLPVDVIYMLIEYCHSAGKTSLRYMERVAQTWDSENIRTINQVEDYIAKTPAPEPAGAKKKGNKFKNFDEREIDYDAVESQMLKELLSDD